MKRSLFVLLAVASLVLAAVPAAAAAKSVTTLDGSPKKAVEKAPDNVYIVRLTPKTRNGRLVYPLTQGASNMAVWKVVIAPERERRLRTHAGYEWLYVLSGELQLVLGEHDLTLRAGEVAEFDTSVPHWFGPSGDESVEILSVHGAHGERMQVRAAPR